MHHTKDLGDKGVFKAILDLHDKGYFISNPMTEHAPFDLIIWKDGKCQTVQVKARNVNSKGVVTINFRNSYCNTKGVVTKDVNKDYIDLYCLYCVDTDKCYYFNPKDFSVTVTFRVLPPKNGQTKNIRLLKEYQNIP